MTGRKPVRELKADAGLPRVQPASVRDPDKGLAPGKAKVPDVRARRTKIVVPDREAKAVAWIAPAHGVAAPVAKDLLVPVRARPGRPLLPVPSSRPMPRSSNCDRPLLFVTWPRRWAGDLSS
jgi:hypothetical protein